MFADFLPRRAGQYEYYEGLYEYVVRDNDLVAAWELDDMALDIIARVRAMPRSKGRNIIINGTFDSDTLWTKPTNGTITGGVLSCAAVPAGQFLIQSGVPFVIGRWYEARVTVSNYSDAGVFKFQIGSTGQSVNVSANGTYSFVIQAGGNLTFSLAFLVAAFTGDIDNVEVRELNIPGTDLNRLGADLVTNGGFDADASWLKGTGHTISGGRFIITAAASLAFTSQTIIPIIPGRTYEVVFTVLNYSSGGVRLIMGGQGYGINRVANGTYTELITAVGGANIIYIQNIGTTTLDVDNVSVREVITGTMPNLVNDWDMEAAGTASWAAGNSATLSKQAGSPFEGTQVLRIARNGVDNPHASQTILTSGRIYRVIGRARSDGNAIPLVLNHGGQIIWQGTNSTSWQVIDFSYAANGTAFIIRSGTTSGVQYCDFDVVTVREEGANLLADGDMKASGVAAWTVSIAGTFSKQTTTLPDGTTGQVIRLQRLSTNSPQLYQVIAQPDKIYRITGYARGNGTVAPRIYLNPAYVWSGTTSANWQYFELTAKHSTDGRFYIESNDVSGAGTNYVEFANVQIVEDNILLPGNRLQDGDMEASGVTWWTAGGSATITKETGAPFAGSQVLRVTRTTGSNSYAEQLVLIIGKRYRVRGYGRGDGTANPRVLDGVGTLVFSGTSSTSWQTIDVVFTAATTSLRLHQNAAVNSYAEFDDITVEEVHPMVGVYGSAVVKGVAPGSERLRKVVRFPGSGNNGVNVYSPTLNSAFDPLKGSLGGWFKISSSAIWTDNTYHWLHSFRLDTNNAFEIIKHDGGGSNRLSGIFRAGGTTVTIYAPTTFKPTGWFYALLTWDKANNVIAFYVNGVLMGTDVYTGTWSGNIAATNAALGTLSSTYQFPHSGELGIAALYNQPKSRAWAAEQFRRGVQRVG